MDPFDTEKIWEHLHRHTFWGMGGGVVITSAMAAIDIACWDIKGKALGVPVYKLLGGKTNPKLRAYASQLQFGWSDLIQKDNNSCCGLFRLNGATPHREKISSFNSAIC